MIDPTETWELLGGGDIIKRHPDGRIEDIAAVYSTVGDTYVHRARLLTASPKLLQAVKRLLSWERIGCQVRAEDIAFAQQALAEAEVTFTSNVANALQLGGMEVPR
jgi:hypothetical protein